MSLNRRKCLHRRNECLCRWNELHLRLSSRSVWDRTQTDCLAAPRRRRNPLCLRRRHLVFSRRSCHLERIRSKPNTVTPLAEPSKPEYRFNNNVPSRSLERTHLSILSWNPGLRRGREGAIEEHIAEKWHVIALQEAIEYLHESFLHYPSCWLCCLVEQRHLSLGHRCQVHVPPRHRKWATSNRERRTIRMGTTKPSSPVLHSGGYREMASPLAKKLGNAKNLQLAVLDVMYQQQVHLVAGDFNGAEWRHQSGSDPRPIRIIEETFANTNLPMPPAPHCCGDQEACQVKGRVRLLKTAGFRK